MKRTDTMKKLIVFILWAGAISSMESTSMEQPSVYVPEEPKSTKSELRGYTTAAKTGTSGTTESTKKTSSVPWYYRTTTSGDDCNSYNKRCHNGGTCHYSYYSGYYCDCPDDAYGDYCQFRTSTTTTDRATKRQSTYPTPSTTINYHCSSHNKRCQNGGTCRYSYYCDCPDGTYGNYCQFLTSTTTTDRDTYKPTYSTSSPSYGDNCKSSNKWCHNGGICRYSYQYWDYRCDCPGDTYGDYCQFKLSSSTIDSTTDRPTYSTSSPYYGDDCRSSNKRCENGGRCKYSYHYGYYHCDCPGLTYGDYCQFKYSTSTIDSTTDRPTYSTSSPSYDYDYAYDYDYSTTDSTKPETPPPTVGPSTAGDDCNSWHKRCRNGGTCRYSYYSGYYCDCRGGTYGESCQFWTSTGYTDWATNKPRYSTQRPKSYARTYRGVKIEIDSKDNTLLYRQQDYIQDVMANMFSQYCTSNLGECCDRFGGLTANTGNTQGTLVRKDQCQMDYGDYNKHYFTMTVTATTKMDDLKQLCNVDGNVAVQGYYRDQYYFSDEESGPVLLNDDILQYLLKNSVRDIAEITGVHILSVDQCAIPQYEKCYSQELVIGLSVALGVVTFGRIAVVMVQSCVKRKKRKTIRKRSPAASPQPTSGEAGRPQSTSPSPQLNCDTDVEPLDPGKALGAGEVEVCVVGTNQTPPPDSKAGQSDTWPLLEPSKA